MDGKLSQGRITMSSLGTPSDFISALSENNPGAIHVLLEWISSNPGPEVILEMLVIDGKRLYGQGIWDLYKLCGNDIERFKYHVLTELPNQETGQLSVTCPYRPNPNDSAFWEKRRFGKPGSFWALENPPSEADYAYPIA